MTRQLREGVDAHGKGRRARQGPQLQAVPTGGDGSTAKTAGRRVEADAVLLGSEVSELAWERAKLPTCFDGLGIRVAQMVVAAQATKWSAADLHKAVMTTILRGAGQAGPRCAPGRGEDLLTAEVDDYAKVMVEPSPWVVGKRAAEIVRPAPVQSADWVPPKSLARDMAFAKTRTEDPVRCGGGASCEITW